jgi:hypothetical protein
MVAKTASIIVGGAQTIGIGLKHTNKEHVVSVLVYMDHNMVFTLGCGRQLN